MGAVTLAREPQIVASGGGYSRAQIDLIKRTVAADCDHTEFDLFMEVARRIGLDPFRKQIYAVVYNKDKPERRKMSIITGIDGYRAVAARSDRYRPDDQPPEIEINESLKSSQNPLGIVRAVVKAYRYGPDGQWYPAVGVAYWSEYVPLKAAEYKWVDTGETWADSGKPKKKKVAADGSEEMPDGKWATMPHVMLAKCAEAQALRKGWPEDLSGIYVREEMDQAEAIDGSASQAIEQYQSEQRQRQIGTAGVVYIGWRAGEPNEAVPAGQMTDRCAEFFAKSESIAELEAWRERNRVALQDFWARHKADALGVREALDDRLKALEGL